ncbi:MAG TPA: fatty acid desaturase, partial [Armatimonadota bacterium]
MSEAAHGAGQQPEKSEWYQTLAQYEKPDYRQAIWQVSTTTVPLLGLLALMLYLVKGGSPYWITLALSVVAAGLLIRSFIFLHDASHGSFFPSQRANTILGFFVGVLTMTPYGEWRWSHLTHHATFANLDRRGVGDIKVMTVEEYQAAPRKQQRAYRLYRHPLVWFGLGSTLLFALIYRRPMHSAPRSEYGSVWWTDVAILAMVVVAGLTVGLRPFFLVMAPVWIIAWAVGVWLFYMQHQFQGVYWAREDAWDFFQASLGGASYYKLPKVLQWFTGNIGLHHLH